MGGGNMTVPVLTVICAALLAAVIILLIFHYKSKKEIDALCNNIENYLTKGKKSDYSVNDNYFSRLNNDICDLEYSLEMQKENRIADNRQNADFVADVSHQLKTPLAGIKLYCEMAQSKSNTEYAEKEMQLINKMESLVSQLLRLQKIKSDAYTMDFRENSLNDLVNGVTEDLKAIYPDRSITVSGSAVLRCDRDWLGEAVGNIIKNACEHTAADGKICVNIEETEKCVLVTIEDNGGGVADSDLPMLFNRFYKAENCAPNSTGIGLAISKEITEKHHGTVFAENTGDGLKVTMCFPVFEGKESFSYETLR